MTVSVIIPETLYSKAQSMGVDHLKLSKMLKMSARLTHVLGNYRYENFVFKVENGVLMDIQTLVIAPECNGLNILRTLPNGLLEVVCPDCNDDGQPCNTCESSGVLVGSEGYLKALMN